MSINAHRIKEVVYEDNAMSFRSGSALASAIENHSDTNDFRNMDSGGILETTLRALKEILAEAKKKKLEAHEILALKAEIAMLEAEGKDDDDYIQYDMF